MLTAIVGGAIGFLLGALARALGIPGDVRSHDASIADRDEALATWVADRDYALKRTCRLLRERLPQEATDESSQWQSAAATTDRLIADARAGALHEYRDEQRRAALDVATILSPEGWAHRLYRSVTRRSPPILNTPKRAVPVLDAWRKPSSMAVALTYPDDATKRTLEDAIATMPATGP